MSAIKNLVAKPTYLSMFSQRCSYCGIPNSGHTHGDAQAGPRLAVLACMDHGALAKRDARAWMNAHGYVLLQDVTGDPLFGALGYTDDHWVLREPLPMSLTVKRTSGVLEPGWGFRCVSTYMDPIGLQRDGAGKWCISVVGPQGHTKGIIVDELTFSLPEDKHDLVAAFVARLDAGIYKADADAHAAAVAAGAAPATAMEPAGIQTVFAPEMGGLGRVCYPPTPEGRKVEGAA